MLSKCLCQPCTMIPSRHILLHLFVWQCTSCMKINFNSVTVQFNFMKLGVHEVICVTLAHLIFWLTMSTQRMSSRSLQFVSHIISSSFAGVVWKVGELC